jgi:hypothetical protein
MSEKLTALASENLNPGLRSLLEDVQRGHIRVPRFQRNFVWIDEQRLALLDSISKKMPIGSLLIWRTSQFRLASFNAVGPQTIPPVAEQPPSIGWQYLLDGHQRVSTLLGLLLPQSETGAKGEPDRHGKEVDWDIRYDLMEERFIFAEKERKKNVAPHPLLALWALLDGRLLNRQMRELRNAATTHGWTAENLDQWEDRANRIAYRFQECRIPVVVMVTDDLNLAIQTFQRVNTQGTAMGEADLVAALTWGEDFDLREQINALREELPPGWRDLADSVFLQVSKGLADLDITRGDERELVKKIRANPALLEQAGNSLARAIGFLQSVAAVPGQQFLPYLYQLTLLAIELGKRAEQGRTPPPPMSILCWFWRTSWGERFASASYRTIRNEQAYLREIENHPDQVEWERDDLSSGRFDFRLARTVLFMLRMALRGDLLDHDGNALDGSALLVSSGRDALSRLFVPPAKASPELRTLVQGAGNRVFYPPEKVAGLRDRLLRGPDLAPAVLQSLFIGPEALRALRDKDMETFLALRFAAINAWDEAEFNRTKAAASA